jgi:Bacterial Ig domain
MFRPVRQLQTTALLVMVIVLLAGCNLGTPQATPVPTPDIPTVQILSPPNNTQVIEDIDFDIDILAIDESQGINKIELYVDGALINDNTVVGGAVPQYRVTMNWLAQGVGFHVMSVIAFRADGTRSDEELINIEVLPRN